MIKIVLRYIWILATMFGLAMAYVVGEIAWNYHELFLGMSCLASLWLILCWRTRPWRHR